MKDITTKMKEDIVKLLIDANTLLEITQKVEEGWLVGWFEFYGISTFVGYLMPNLFLYK